MTDKNKSTNQPLAQPQLAQGYLGVDTGGTFTDFYWCGQGESKIHKVLSTPKSPEQAILQGIDELGLTGVLKAGKAIVIHGSTVATNAALERKGVRTAFVTNKGFADMLSLGRQNRDDIYALNALAQADPVSPELCLEVDCRRDADGNVVTALSNEAIQQLKKQVLILGVEAVAINLLFSYLDGGDEERLAKALPNHLFVCCSSEVLPEYKEYERGMVTWLNAWLGPKVEQYIQRLLQGVSPSPLAVMQSSGGTIAAQQVSRKAVNLLLSGPAGGLAAARYIGQQLRKPRLLTFDMGGTSTDVALIDGDIRLSCEGRLGPYPVAVPMVDMHTIGAGGGSLAYLDSGGMLHVGPESSGAVPGPACYGQGGLTATVTDANVVLGRLRPNNFLGGRMTLDLDGANKVIGELARQMGVTLEQAAEGIIALSNEHMARALRVISVQKGYDPADFDLCCFGGAGGLHVCALAEELGVSRVLIPANGGVLSAFGMLVAPKQRQLSRTVTRLLSEIELAEIIKIAHELELVGRAELLEEGVRDELKIHISLDCRYQGQSFYLNIACDVDNIADLERGFHKHHKASYGHKLPLAIELVNVRVSIEADAERMLKQERDLVQEDALPIEVAYLPRETTVWDRGSIAIGQVIRGPAIICEAISTTLVAEDWRLRVDGFGHLHLDSEEG